MADGKFVVYLRVSTDRQGESGLGLEAQKAAVATYLNGGKHTVIAEFTEVESGKRADRPVLAEAITLAKRRKATLIIAKLDRLARNVHFVSGLMETDVTFVACDMPQADRFMIHLYAAMAEQEARNVSARTKAALVAAKARGVVLGGRRMPEGEWKAVAAAGRRKALVTIQRNAAANRERVLPLIHGLRLGGATTLQQIADELNLRSIETPSGKGGWSRTQVMRLLAAE